MKQKKRYTVYGVVDNEDEIPGDRTLFYFNRDYAKAAVKLMNESCVEKKKPYRVKKFCLAEI